jgi:uncharacterized membrane protein YgcG
MLAALTLVALDVGAAVLPPGLAGLTGPLQSVPRQRVVVEDLARKLDEAVRRAALQPRVFALADRSGWSLANGRWEPLNDGSWVWRLHAHASKATSLNFRFDQLSLPGGAQLFVYAPDGSDVRGPYTHQDIQSGKLWTPVVRGEDAIIEISAPADQKAEVQLGSGQAYYGFFPFWKDDAVQFKEGSCHVDVACAQAQPHAQQVRAVARIQIELDAATSALCTANLTNNSQLDRRPLMLTANHCISAAGTANSVVVYWNFQRSSCRGGSSSLDQTTEGASLRANSLETDFSLIELNGVPPASFSVFYAGWNRSAGVPASTFVIHHPEGTEKRYSEDFQPPVITNLPCVENCGGVLPIPAPRAGAAGSALQVLDYDVGTTEPGSSGAALFNPQGQIVAQLSQGSALCGNDEPDWYGRLAQSWEGGGTASSRLKDWLDPSNSGAMSIAGLESAGSGGSGGTGGSAGSGGAAGSGGSAGASGGTGGISNNAASDSGGGCTLTTARTQTDTSLMWLLFLAFLGLILRMPGLTHVGSRDNVS